VGIACAPASGVNGSNDSSKAVIEPILRERARPLDNRLPDEL
jgi:hypothetical protein